MKSFTYSIVFLFFASFTMLPGQGGNDIGLQALRANAGQNGYSESDFSNVVISDDYISKGIHHIYYLQAMGGMSIYGSTAAVHLKDGQVLASNNRFIPGLSQMQVSSTISLSAIEAVKALCNMKEITLDPAGLNIISENTSDVHQTTKLSPSNIALSEITAKLMYYKSDDNTLKVAWSIGIEMKENGGEWMNYFIDADTGTLLNEVSWTVNHNHEEDAHNHKDHNDSAPVKRAKSNITAPPSGASYNVFAAPIESPLYGSRSIVTDPANAIASPFGWHDTNGAQGAEHTDTRGNNVDAFIFGSGFRPDGGAALNFDFPLDLTQNPNTYQPAAVTNLFYWNNHIHDVMYGYGFDEASGNFQVNNYGNGGMGNDAVNARAQIATFCNATFGTPADGSSPTMNMFVCNQNGLADGNFDNLVVVHEYAHGISNRLTGGPALAGCLGNREQMGEGWSDWYGLMLTMDPSDVGTGTRSVGNFLFGQTAAGGGIRAFPYSTDLTVDPRTYADVAAPNAQGSPHAMGSIWAAMLWELTWTLIDNYGFDADLVNGVGGNNIALQLVTEGLKLQPCSPGFVDGRDAILAADIALFDGANQCYIWNAFAKRGLGFSADQGSSDSRTDGTEAFDLPDNVPNMCPPPVVIPTMPQWMLFILGLVMMSLSVVYIRRQSTITA